MPHWGYRNHWGYDRSYGRGFVRGYDRGFDDGAFGFGGDLDCDWRYGGGRYGRCYGGGAGLGGLHGYAGGYGYGYRGYGLGGYLDGWW